MRKIFIEKKSLQHLYCDQNLSSRVVAKIYNCDQGVVLRNLRKYNLPVKHPKKKIPIPKKELKELYLKKKLSTYKVARIYNCDPKTIYLKLKQFGIPARPRKKVKITKEKLKSLYFNKRLSLAAIGKLYGCNQVAIYKKMKKFGFSLRTSWETNEKHPKYNFSGNLLEKAYLLGFRAGDLGVRRISERTGNIHVGCNSTKLAQIKLIKNLFKNYGPVWISEPNERGVRSIDTTLNFSFSFLLPKKDKISSWILKNKNYFAAYLGGYSDAEGSIGIYHNRARFRLGSYDVGILKDIAQVLISQGIKALLRLERKAGIDKRGKIYRSDFWRITINEKASLLALFKLIGLHLKHFDRIKAVQQAIQNIKERNKKFSRKKKT